MSQNRVGVFWDYENCAPPCEAVARATESIRRIALGYGQIMLWNAYAEVNHSIPYSARVDLQTYGVALVDCPHNQQKDVVDKKMIVDMLQYVYETPGPHTIILITGDHDFTPAIALLTLRMHKVVIIAPGANHRAPANEILDWGEAVLGKRPSAHQRAASCSAVPTANLRSSGTNSSRRASVGAGRGLSPGPRHTDPSALLEVPPQSHCTSPNHRSSLRLRTDAVTLATQEATEDVASSGGIEYPERPCATGQTMSNLPSPFDSVYSLSPIDSCGLRSPFTLASEVSRAGSSGEMSEGSIVAKVPIGANSNDVEWATRVIFGDDARPATGCPPSITTTPPSCPDEGDRTSANTSRTGTPAAQAIIGIREGTSISPLIRGSGRDAGVGDTSRHQTREAETATIVVTPAENEGGENDDDPIHLFGKLIDILDKKRTADPQRDSMMLWSQLSSKMTDELGSDWLKRREPYSASGYKKFKDYIARAKELGIVTLCTGSTAKGCEWVRLSRRWYGRGPTE